MVLTIGALIINPSSQLLLSLTGLEFGGDVGLTCIVLAIEQTEKLRLLVENESL
jgi:hypothetical protein